MARKAKGLLPPSRVNFQGQEILELSLSHPHINAHLQQAAGNFLGYYEARNYNNRWPMSLLVGHLDDLGKALEDNGLGDWKIPSEDTSEPDYLDFHGVYNLLTGFRDEIIAQLEAKKVKGQFEFQDLIYLFQKGDELSARHKGEMVGGTLESIKLVRTMFGQYYAVQINMFSNAFGSLKELPLTINVGDFQGLADLKDLPVHFITDEEKAILTKRGEIFARYCKGVNYIQYEGLMTRSSYWSPMTYRATGRVMMDVKSFQQVDSNQFSTESRMSGLNDDDDDRNSNDNDQDIVLKPEDLWRTFPFLYGFSLSAKQWGRMKVDGLSDIKFREDAFDKLVLPQEDKDLIRAIVQDDGADFSDIIDGKGGGSIFLLHGPPGQGKTLTAEAIAEVLKRPLYSISVGELGTNPDSLESTLRVILDIASVWNAVLLLDEADIFLEERDEKDIVRNAMVGVFLRLLEYHQGVLFLTTNRVKNIDKAFYSRISIGLRFQESNADKRSKIWTNLLDSAEITGQDPQALAKHELNGREIKNIIRLSKKLARAKNGVVDEQLIASVIQRTKLFHEDETAR